MFEADSRAYAFGRDGESYAFSLKLYLDYFICSLYMETDTTLVGFLLVVIRRINVGVYFVREREVGRRWAGEVELPVGAEYGRIGDSDCIGKRCRRSEKRY